MEEELTPEIRNNTEKRLLSKRQIVLVIAILAVLFGGFLILPAIFKKISLKSSQQKTTISLTETQLDSLKTNISTETSKLEKKYTDKTPKAAYIIINTSANEFALYNGFDLIKKDKCSTGSYVLLKRGDKQQWMFKTPKGEFKIRSKKKEPVWKKPDWAFVEAGLPVPSANHSSRFEYGVLGDYALTLGDGYLIHGTLYQRFLGLPVTHGCVRLNDANLELVYKTLNVGAKVYIF
jgi:L,D-transpeptidase ErfK/SrfK